jgi:DNA polymerase III epsilon subunit-like protein
MQILVFDTETTGLPKTKLLTYETLCLWPYILQLSYVIYDVSANSIINVRDFIIKIPKEIEISEESTAIHGITKKICNNSEETIEDALVRFIYDFSHSDLIVGHNLSFDLNMLKIETMRQILKNNKNKDLYVTFLQELKTADNYYCTMHESMDLCNIQALDKKGNNYTKFPKLEELHEILFHAKPKNLHNALVDVLVCLRCYYMLEYQKDLLRINREFRYLFHL